MSKGNPLNYSFIRMSFRLSRKSTCGQFHSLKGKLEMFRTKIAFEKQNQEMYLVPKKTHHKDYKC